MCHTNDVSDDTSGFLLPGWYEPSHSTQNIEKTWRKISANLAQTIQQNIHWQFIMLGHHYMALINHLSVHVCATASVHNNRSLTPVDQYQSAKIMENIQPLGVF